MNLYAVVGKPILHSLSPLTHNAAFASLRLPARYVRLAADDDQQLSGQPMGNRIVRPGGARLSQFLLEGGDVVAQLTRDLLELRENLLFLGGLLAGVRGRQLQLQVDDSLLQLEQAFQALFENFVFQGRPAGLFSRFQDLVRESIEKSAG